MPAKGFQELRPALIAVGFLRMAGQLFDFSLHPFTLAAVFLAAFSVYFADHHLPSRHSLTWPLILLYSFTFLGCGYLSGQFNPVGIGVYILLALIYVLPVLPEKKRLQDIPFLRLCAVAGAWAAFPILLKNFPLTPKSVRYFFGILAFMIPAVIWSDLADAEDDLSEGRKTWTLNLPEQKRQVILLSSLLISISCFLLPGLQIMLPGPLLFLMGFSYLHRHPTQSDWVLLWPLVGSSF